MELIQSLFGSRGKAGPVLRALNAARVMEQAGPWCKVADRPVGALTAVGFVRTGEEMLVTSEKGQSVIDGTTGQVIYRNADQDGLDPAALKGTRLDHPADARIDMAGLFGGGLRRVTNDGWSTDIIQTYCLLHPLDASARYLGPDWDSFRKDTTFYLLDRSGEEIRALGFSWTGQTLVVATASRLAIWNRPAPLKL